MAVKEALEGLERKMNSDNVHIQNLTGVLQFDVTGSEATAYQVVFSEGTVELKTDGFTEPKCTLQLSDENLDKLLKGQLNATTAVFTGKLKVKGDLGFAMKIQSVLQKYA